MRLIGHLKDEINARVFGDYLSGLEIENRVEPDNDGMWAIWVYSEEQIDLSRTWLAKFMADPTAPCFVEGAAKAAEIRQRKQQQLADYQERVHTPAVIWSSRSLGVVTLSLIVISVAAALLSGFSFSSELLNPLRITMRTSFLSEVRSGQIWRLITPIFIHSGPLHLLFNMMWLWDLGRSIEFREGSGKLALMVALIAVASNFAQYLNTGPFFGGMSGVVFGLFGYVWIRGKFDPRSGYFMDSTNVALMIFWFFICLFGWVGTIANAAHGVGLVAGMAWGWISSKRD